MLHPVRQCMVASMIESLYWIGMDHPANGTILPAGKRKQRHPGITHVWRSLAGCAGKRPRMVCMGGRARVGVAL